MVSELGHKLEVEKIREANKSWILENLEDILANFPARWCLVDHDDAGLGHVMMANPDFMDLYKDSMRRDDISEGALFFNASNFEPLAIFSRE